MNNIGSLLNKYQVQIENDTIERMSIEKKKAKRGPNIEVPVEVDELTDDKRYINKIKGLIKRGFREELLELVPIAHTKKMPSHWFATVTAKHNWEKTLVFLERMRTWKRMVEDALKKINPTEKVRGYVEYACWRLGSRVERLADTAREVGRSKQRLFCYLAKKEIALL